MKDDNFKDFIEWMKEYADNVADVLDQETSERCVPRDYFRSYLKAEYHLIFRRAKEFYERK